MKVGVNAGIEESKPKLGLNFEFKNEYIGLAAISILSVTAIVIVNAVCKSNLRRGSLDICGVAKLRIGR